MSSEIKSLESLPDLHVKRHVFSPTSSGSTVVSYTKDLGEGPVLWLVHGYPQSAYIPFHQLLTLMFADPRSQLASCTIPVVAQLRIVINSRIRLFLNCRIKSPCSFLRCVQLFSTPSAFTRPLLILPPKKLPGYGLSTLKGKPGVAAVGAALLEACRERFPDRPIILAGHDRGARVCHRLAVSNAHPPQDDTTNLHSYKLLGTVLLDIVPTLIQWKSFAHPQASAAYFHWPFLASPIAADMIEAFGAAKWTHLGLDRICGDNAEGRKAMQSDDAWEVYESLLSKREAIEGSCADYASGCFDEPPLQEADQREGRKIQSPTLVMWSKYRLGKMHGGDLGSIWKEWMQDASLLTAEGVGDDVGHYLPEEASTVIGTAIKGFVDKVSK
ncbi:alpha/beta hydrolase [Aureobasidium sp. EXF-10728]|nr:alpha/beta hydrolase [Aureobasidium sp. EXF-10728]